MLEQSAQNVTAAASGDDLLRKLKDIDRQLRRLEQDLNNCNPADLSAVRQVVWKLEAIRHEAVQLVSSSFQSAIAKRPDYAAIEEAAALEQARAGHTDDLIRYLHGDLPISRRLRDFLAEFVAGKIKRPIGRSEGWHGIQARSVPADRAVVIATLFKDDLPHEERAKRALAAIGQQHNETLKRAVMERLRKGRTAPHIPPIRAGIKRTRSAVQGAIKILSESTK